MNDEAKSFHLPTENDFLNNAGGSTAGEGQDSFSSPHGEWLSKLLFCKVLIIQSTIRFSSPYGE